MNTKCQKHYEEFDKAFEELEVQPYAASYEYYKAGWNKVLYLINSMLALDGVSDIDSLTELPEQERKGYINCKEKIIKYIKRLEAK